MPCLMTLKMATQIIVELNVSSHVNMPTKLERERETERQRDRDRERQRDRETERQRDRETERQRDRDRETERQRQRDRETETERQREGVKKRHTENTTVHVYLMYFNIIICTHIHNVHVRGV